LKHCQEIRPFKSTLRPKKDSGERNLYWYPDGTGSVHAYPDFLTFLDRTAEADFDLIEVNMDDFLAIRADFRHLPVEIDWIAATWTAGNDDSNDLCLLLHD
jgi:hypothetical protein